MSVFKCRKGQEKRSKTDLRNIGKENSETANQEKREVLANGAKVRNKKKGKRGGKRNEEKCYLAAKGVAHEK